jgi:hypothetical protein
MRLPTIPLAISLSMACTACKTTPEKAGSAIKHEVGRFDPVDSGAAAGQARPWMWVAVGRQYVETLPGVPPLAPEGFALQKRLQFWASRMHAHAIQQNPQLTNIPVPMVYLTTGGTDGSDNVLALAARVLNLVPLELSPDPVTNQIGNVVRINLNDFDSNEAFAYELTAASVYGQLSFRLQSLNDSTSCQTRSSTYCYERQVPQEWIPEFTRWLQVTNVSLFDSSPLNKILLKGYVTQTGGSFRSRARGIVTPVTANAIVVGRDFITDASEEGLIGALAHEMGHYLRAHSSVLDKQRHYGYPYAQTEDNLQTKPKPASVYNSSNGTYTEEQEADEIAVELLYAMGISHEPFVQQMLSRLRAGKDSRGAQSKGAWSASTCEEARLADWTTQPPVAMGNDQLHHSLCYRIFNLDREFKAHRYTLANKPSDAPQEEWESVKQEFISNVR